MTTETSETTERTETAGATDQTAGLRHVALVVHAFDRCLDFYTRVLGMAIEWQPDPDHAFLSSGNDNLALYRSAEPAEAAGQRLEHIGFLLDAPEDVDRWHERLRAAGVTISQPPRTHRDGARSFFCLDPDGTRVQILHHPPLSRR